MTTRGRGAMPAWGMRRALLTLLIAGLALVASACSTTGKGGYQADGQDRARAGTPTATSSASAGTEKPKFASDFERTCADGLGFGGLAGYSKTAKSVHPAVLLTRNGGETWSQAAPFSDEYPTGWILDYGDDVSRAQLVVCYERTAATPAGRTCEMSDDKTHEKFTLTMYNTAYRLRVLEARTGAVLYDRTGQAKSTDCPMLTFVSSNEDRTKYYTDARPRDYRGALKPFIAP